MSRVWAMQELAGILFSSVQSLTCVRLFVPSWNAARQVSLSFTYSWSVLKLMSIELVMPSTISSSVIPFPSGSVLHIRWPKNWSFSFSINPSNEYSGLISFRMDWFDLLAVQGTLKSLLQYHSSKASILRCSIFFIV